MTKVKHALNVGIHNRNKLHEQNRRTLISKERDLCGTGNWAPVWAEPIRISIYKIKQRNWVWDRGIQALLLLEEGRARGGGRGRTLLLLEESAELELRGAEGGHSTEGGVLPAGWRTGGGRRGTRGGGGGVTLVFAGGEHVGGGAVATGMPGGYRVSCVGLFFRSKYNKSSEL
jgi:hypothetical protein